MKYDASANAWISLLPRSSAAMVSFNPDKQRIAFIKIPESSLWQGKPNAGDERQMSPEGVQAAMPRWSPDGTQLVFMGHKRDEKWQIYVVPLNGEAAAPQVRHNADGDADPAWFLDGQHIMFGRVPGPSDKPVVGKLYVRDLQTSQVVTLQNSDGLFSALPSSDSKHLVAIDLKSRSLMLCDISTRGITSPCIPLAPIGSGGYPAWSSDNTFIYFLYRDQKLGSKISCVNVATKTVDVVVDLATIQQPSFLFGRWIGITPDGLPLAIRDLGEDNIYAFTLK